MTATKYSVSFPFKRQECLHRRVRIQEGCPNLDNGSPGHVASYRSTTYITLTYYLYLVYPQGKFE
jgi:hypothetical protein